MNTNFTKTFLSLLFLIGIVSYSQAQISLDFDNVGNRSELQAECWLFSGFDVRTNDAISGKSLRSSALSSTNEFQAFLITPLVELSSGTNLLFDYEFTNGIQSREGKILVYLQPASSPFGSLDIDNAILLGEVTGFASDNVLAADLSISTTGTFRIVFITPGLGGGSGRGIIDNLVIPADDFSSEPEVTIDAGEDQSICGIAPVVLDAEISATYDNAELDILGVWSGGAGTFSDVNDPNATYTPDPAEDGETVTLTFTAVSCNRESDVVDITFSSLDKVVIDAAAATYLIAPCEETTDFIYSILITGPCDFADDDLVLEGPLATYASDPLVEPRGNDAKYFEFNFTSVPAGIYELTAKFKTLEAKTTITVQAPQEVDLDELSCNDNVNVTLDNECTADVTADMVLEGQNICNDDFTVIFDYGMGMKSKDEITECGKFKYEVFYGTDESTAEFVCWGYITGEDKDAPKYPTQIGEATITCTDIDSILKYSASDIQLKKDGEECYFEGKSWDILLDQGAFDVNSIYDNCSEFCHLSFEINDLLMEGDVCDGSMIVRTI
ncbi:MAG: hypothetical protein AAFO07_00325, partial [Bacteroidota bacterium]